MDISILTITKRIVKCLNQKGIKGIEDLRIYSLYEIAHFKNFGMGSFCKLLQSLNNKGFNIEIVFKKDRYSNFIVENYKNYNNIMHMVDDADKIFAD